MKINVVENVLKANDAVAEANRRRLEQVHLLAVNLMSSPGSGKTTLLESTIPALGTDFPCAVLVGDLQTTRDAERLGRAAVQATQINTGKGCHLDAAQVAEGLKGLDLERLAFLFIENVGNMVCPASYDLGEHVKAVLLSVPEGDDKVAKYPVLFQGADVILLTKIDLIGVLDFDRDRVLDDISKLNTRAPIIEVSSKTGQGIDKWLAWLAEQRKQRVETLE
ncbi:MAG: hydrogenase nickel incorporation protein HypB [Planctomycetota bacterium]|nr:MAG: hydrogenase nickel incorporation protein HypB [Planctomycetota bacterium]